MSTETPKYQIDSTEAEVTQPLTKRQAAALDDRIRKLADGTVENLCQLKALLVEAKTGQVHLTMGFASWTGYVADALGGRLEVAEGTRTKVVGLLAGEGMSLRAIAKATGTSKTTVQRELSHNGTVDRPEKVISLDGRERPSKRTPTPIEQAAAAVGAQIAKRLSKEAPDLHEKVERKELTILAAERELRERAAMKPKPEPEPERPGATEYSRAIQQISWDLAVVGRTFTDEELAETLGAAQFLHEMLRGQTTIRKNKTKAPTERSTTNDPGRHLN